ncbi:hypothetical protein PVAND_016526 [Polypedilum vanderplanki]|uniref:Uncharacterized protein n=1 Tax=Polypedilum vanderplanki TaxID=319348 RepID=A0A9J6BGJ2_POLVA|nr:hypothetical protein PVAND_016526 [Polypedilum vanderplanki]
MVNLPSIHIEQATTASLKKKTQVFNLSSIKSSMKKANNYKPRPMAISKTDQIKKPTFLNSIKEKIEFAKAKMMERTEKVEKIEEKNFEGDLYEIDISKLFIIPKNKIRPDLIVKFKKIDLKERERIEKLEKLKRKRSIENYYLNDEIATIEKHQEKKRKF